MSISKENAFEVMDGSPLRCIKISVWTVVAMTEYSHTDMTSSLHESIVSGQDDFIPEF
jgi:hypothetical protein